jgi:glycerophosphoryl diester phosphodiesterase
MVFPYFDIIPTPIAHRGFTFVVPDGSGGLRSNGLENSMTAFQAAVDLGYEYVETDIHGSRDGVAVISHDHTLDRTTDHKGEINKLDWAEIQQAKICPFIGPDQAATAPLDRKSASSLPRVANGTEPIPRLDDLLAAWPNLRVNIHLKSDDAAAPVAEVIERFKAHDRVGLTSFSSPRRKYCESLLSKPVAAGAGTAEMFEITAGAHLHTPSLIRAALHAVDCVQIYVGDEQAALHSVIVDREMVSVMHDAGKFVHVWTPNDPVEFNRLLDLGVDGIITDRADLLKQVLADRGQWRNRTW